MKISLILLFAISLIIPFSSCDSTSDKDEYKSTGVITGYDMRECVCCGGYFIVIEDSTYRFDKLPDNSELKLNNPVFPINVLLDWRKSEHPCMGDEIIIERIKEKN